MHNIYINQIYDVTTHEKEYHGLNHLYHVCTTHQDRDSSPYDQIISHSFIQSCCTPITSKHTVAGLEPWEQSGHLNGHHPIVTETYHVHTHIYMHLCYRLYIYI